MVAIYVAIYSDIPLSELSFYFKSYHDFFPRSSFGINLHPHKLGKATTK